MKTVYCWQDLLSFGIDALTGEACGLSYRILFDVTDKGRKILSRAFGVPNLQLAEPWNRGSKEEPHVGSILLAPEMFVPVAIFALLESGCPEVWRLKDCVVGFEARDSPEERQRFLETMRARVVRRYAFDGTAGDRNRHAMSGRVE